MASVSAWQVVPTMESEKKTGWHRGLEQAVDLLENMVQKINKMCADTQLREC